jgi:broad specificity phosphatase PhoE
MIRSRFSPLITLAALAAMIGGCAAGVRADAPADETTYILVRHAEKAADDPKDPTLSEAGHARARRLAERLADANITAVYATGYRRTQLTAAAAAQAHSVGVLTYDAAMPAPDFAAELRRKHAAGVVLVVGHSNTVAAIAASLCACTVAPLREDEYDRWIAIRVAGSGAGAAVAFEEARY